MHGAFVHCTSELSEYLMALGFMIEGNHSDSHQVADKPTDLSATWLEPNATKAVFN